ncbi:MAG: FHA domain-containing protein [Archangiaceae bacterium]|nr:FHA domain-containing protein [Archangiaceae bacterium]
MNGELAVGGNSTGVARGTVPAAMVRAYLLSFLARQYLVLNQGFAPRYPHAWLVWEPGSWRAPPPDASVAETRLPTQGAAPVPGPGDALCFELALPADRREPLRLGRAETNELVLSDATVSREHCLLRRDAGGWYVKASDSVKALKVSGRALAAGEEVAVSAGDRLELGEVTLTLLDAPRLVERVKAHATHPAHP